MPQLPPVTAQRRDVSADMEGQQLPWIPTEKEERKEEMSLCNFCQHATKFDNQIICKKKGVNVELLNVTHCKWAYEAPEEEKVETNIKPLTKEELKAGQIVYACSYGGLTAYIITYKEYCQHIIGFPIFPFDENTRRIEDCIMFSNIEDAIAYYREYRMKQLEKERLETIKRIDQTIDWFMEGVKEKRWEK